MTRLELEIDQRHVEAAIGTEGDLLTLECEGRRVVAEVIEPEPGSLLVIIDNRVFRVSRETDPQGGERITVNGREMHVRALDKKHRRGHETHGSGQVLLTSPMPGKVVSVLLAAGNRVSAREGVVVVEAMKMQNEIQAPRAGQLVEVRVSAGDTVNAGEVLAVIE